MSKNKPKGIIEKVEIGDMVAEGKCITRHDNQAIFIEKVAPGDIVDLKVVKKKKKYLEAIPVKFHGYSNLRSEPFCDHFGLCGGCKWQHLEYEQQLAYKEQQVKDSLERLGGLHWNTFYDILPSPDTTYYRNKLEFTFSDKRWLSQEEVDSGEVISDTNALGFHVPRRFDKVLDIEHCYLQQDPSNAIRNEVRNYARANQTSFFDIVQQKGFLRNLIIRTTLTGDLMVILSISYEDKPVRESILQHIHNKFPQITSLQYVINNKGNDSINDLPVHCYAGQPYIAEQIEDLTFQIGPLSFFQTNTRQAVNLYKKVAEFAAVQAGDLVYDLYTGIGTIACYLARYAKEVIGFENIASAVEDAAVNAKINDLNNTAFYAGNIKDVLSKSFVKQNGKPDVIITDPPRAGMHESVIRSILALKPRKVIYISCNPATQARDLAMLSGKFEIDQVQPVDMFPHTYHVENIVSLNRSV